VRGELPGNGALKLALAGAGAACHSVGWCRLFAGGAFCGRWRCFRWRWCGGVNHGFPFAAPVGAALVKNQALRRFA